MSQFRLSHPGSLSLLGALFCCAAVAAHSDSSRPGPADVPAPEREFRAVWVATVANIDWPSRPGLPTAEQQRELLAILDRCTQLRMNAVVLQVRPATDALYESSLEPWSEYLTGEMGKAPSPYYDPLAFAVEEAHKRGLELHAWFNPYRSHHPSAKGPIHASHVSKSKADLVRQYGQYQWMDPGEKGTQDHSLAVIRDVVRRYDLDGVHIDDYFYPYKEKDSAGNVLDFPDEPSWQRYVRSGGKLSRDDWRRNNVDSFIERLYAAIKAEKKWVKFGISPFGIWRPGNPPQIQGFDQYAELYADARKWLREGWLDYWTPQLYWRIEQTPQSYPVLLGWWAEQNVKGRNLWPGNYTGRVGDGSANNWAPEEVVNQIKATRAQKGATGNVHFSMKVFMQNRAGLGDLLAREVYEEPALVPASPWLDSTPPARPKARLRTSRSTGTPELTWQPGSGEKPWQWVVQVKAGGKWSTQVLPGWQQSQDLRVAAPASAAEAIAVSAVDRCGNQSVPVVLSVKKSR